MLQHHSQHVYVNDERVRPQEAKIPQELTDALASAMQTLAKRRPDNPIRFLASCLLNLAGESGLEDQQLIDPNEVKGEKDKKPVRPLSACPARLGAPHQIVDEACIQCGRKLGDNGIGVATEPRKDPQHEFYGSWEKIQRAKEEYLTKGPYYVKIHNKSIKMHHNYAGVASHTSCMVNHLSQDVYNSLKDKFTVNGVTLDKCIKIGIENPCRLNINTVGMTAGDAESYEVFAALFDPVIDERHGGYPTDAIHTSDMDSTKIKDPSVVDAKYVISTRVRSGRNIRGIPFPPSCNKEERRKLERIVTKALMKLDGSLAGEYYPLAGSQSYVPKVGGMTEEEEKQLREEHFLFEEPSSTLLVSVGLYRDWPDARGIFLNKDKNALVWVNEEDHLRIISMEKGPDIKAVFMRFAGLCDEVEKMVKAEGFSFAHSDHLGYILTCPSNLGTGLRAGMMVKLPHLGSDVHKVHFKNMATQLGIQIREAFGEDSVGSGVFDLSNSARLGKSEVELINIMIDGVAALIEEEKRLEAEAESNVDAVEVTEEPAE